MRRRRHSAASSGRPSLLLESDIEQAGVCRDGINCDVRLAISSLAGRGQQCGEDPKFYFVVKTIKFTLINCGKEPPNVPRIRELATDSAKREVFERQCRPPQSAGIRIEHAFREKMEPWSPFFSKPISQ